MKFFIRTVILLVVPFQYSGASEMGAPVDLIDWLLALEAVIQVISVACILYLTSCTSYLKEKGKNVATKEDIKSITEEVETVKNSLLLSTQAKLSLHNEERESLINSWEKMYHWYSVVVVMPLKAKIGDVEYFDKAALKLKNARIECGAAWARAELFNSNRQLAKSYNELFCLLNELSHTVGIALLRNKHLQEIHGKWSTRYAGEFREIHTSLLNNLRDERANMIELKKKFRDIISKNLKKVSQQ